MVAYFRVFCNLTFLPIKRIKNCGFLPFEIGKPLIFHPSSSSSSPTMVMMIIIIIIFIIINIIIIIIINGDNN